MAGLSAGDPLQKFYGRNLLTIVPIMVYIVIGAAHRSSPERLSMRLTDAHSPESPRGEMPWGSLHIWRCALWKTLYS